MLFEAFHGISRYRAADRIKRGERAKQWKTPRRIPEAQLLVHKPRDTINLLQNYSSVRYFDSQPTFLWNKFHRRAVHASVEELGGRYTVQQIHDQTAEQCILPPASRTTDRMSHAVDKEESVARR